MRCSDDGRATSVGIRVDVEGVIGNPVDQTAGMTVCRSAVVMKGTYRIVQGADVVVDKARVHTCLQEMAPECPRGRIDDLRATLVRIGYAPHTGWRTEG
jgi:hypothetical protein